MYPYFATAAPTWTAVESHFILPMTYLIRTGILLATWNTTMDTKVQVTLDKAVYDRLLELRVPPYSDINSVIERLLYHGGHKSREAIALEEEEKALSFEDELKRSSEGDYAGSGIGT